jgi:GH24 family phage-related lysozyme (muramidase)
LTPTLAHLVANGDVEGVVEAIDARGVDNRGVNTRRRYAEATLFAAGSK